MASPPRLLAQRPAPASPFLRSCSAHSAHWNRDEGLGLPFRPWGWVGSSAGNSAQCRWCGGAAVVPSPLTSAVSDSTSVPVWKSSDFPVHRAAYMIVAALRQITQGKIDLKLGGGGGGLNGRNSTDFTQPSLSHCPATCPNLRRGRIQLAFEGPIDGVETTPATAYCRCAGNPANSRPSFDGPSNAPPCRRGDGNE